MGKITYKIYTLGCKVNQYDSSDLSSKMEGSGFELVEKDAEVAIVNTCAVTKTAISKAKRMLTLARKENPGAKIVLMGCWPKTYQEEVNDFEVDLIWEVGKIDDLLHEISALLDHEINYSESHTEQIAKTDKSRYFIKVQDGCEQFCTYCVIPYARGKLKSRHLDEVVDEIRIATDEGFEEIVLSGIHLGLYGIDIKSSLYELLKELIKIDKLGRLRLSSIEMGEVTDEIIQLTKENEKICDHLHIPLQAGTDKILKLMNRPYNLKQFEEKINDLRKAIPDIALTTDVIVGFPGESDSDFDEAVDYIKKIKFSKLHVFPYSAHEKTPASKFPGQVSSNNKKIRAKRLRELGEKLEEEYKKEYWDNKVDKICIERIEEKGIKGLSEHYLQVICLRNVIKDKEIRVGKITEAMIV